MTPVPLFPAAVLPLRIYEIVPCTDPRCPQGRSIISLPGLNATSKVGETTDGRDVISGVTDSGVSVLSVTGDPPPVIVAGHVRRDWCYSSLLPA